MSDCNVAIDTQCDTGCDKDAQQDGQSMSDYNATAVWSGYDQHQWEAWEGTITVDEIEHYWRYEAWEYGNGPNGSPPRPLVGLYQILPRNTRINTKWRLRDGRKLRRIPTSRRRDHEAIKAAILEACVDETEVWKDEEPRDDLYPAVKATHLTRVEKHKGKGKQQ